MPIILLEKFIFVFFVILGIGICMSNAITDAAIFLIITTWFLLLITKKQKPSFLNDKILCVLIGVFILANVLSFFNTGFLINSFRGMLKVVKFLLLFLASLDFFRDKVSRLRYSFCFILISLFIYFDALWQNAFGVDIFRHHRLIAIESARRLTASFNDPNNFAGYIIVSLLVAMALLFASGFLSKKNIGISKHLIRVGLIILVLLGFFCLYRTLSRGAWLGFLVGLVVLFSLRGKKALLGLVVLLVLSGMFAPSIIKAKLTNAFDFSQGTTSWERTKIWEGVTNMIKVHPVVGHGVNTYSENFKKYKPEDYPDLRYAHNCYLQMASEVGFFGLISFLVLIGYVLVTAMRSIIKQAGCFDRAVNAGFLCACVAFLAHSFVDTHLYSLVMAALFWMCLGFVGASKYDLSK